LTRQVDDLRGCGGQTRRQDERSANKTQQACFHHVSLLKDESRQHYSLLIIEHHEAAR
jgi:hypothetical protein